MIQSELTTVCAEISRSAMVKEGKDGKSFITFGVSMLIDGRDGSKRALEISVSADGDKSSASYYSQGRRVRVLGNLRIVKKDGKTYFNLRADGGIELCKSTEADNIEGELSFKGKLGARGVEIHKDRKGKDFQVFSAVSVDKDGEQAEFTWVRFLNFHPTPEADDCLKPGAYVEVKGDLQLSVWKESLSIDCRVKDVKPWVLKKVIANNKNVNNVYEKILQ